MSKLKLKENQKGLTFFYCVTYLTYYFYISSNQSSSNILEITLIALCIRNFVIYEAQG